MRAHPRNSHLNFIALSAVALILLAETGVNIKPIAAAVTEAVVEQSERQTEQAEAKVAAFKYVFGLN